MDHTSDKLTPCSRCGGRMLLDAQSTDQPCFTCGNVISALPVITVDIKPRERRTSHGGKSLA